jgi:hypothetical protein
MAESKYGKHIIREPRDQIYEDGALRFDGILVESEKLGTNCNIFFSAVKEPRVDEANPHVHDFPEVFGFFGSNPQNLYDFDAEIEFYLGGEKHIIDTMAIVSIPAGLSHCPLIFKRIGKPVLWLELMLTSKYGREESDE